MQAQMLHRSNQRPIERRGRVVGRKEQKERRREETEERES